MLERTIDASGNASADGAERIRDIQGGEGELAGVFSFRHAFKVIARRKWLILFCAAVCITIAVLISSLTPPQYTARTQLLFNESDVRVLDQQEVFLEETLSNPFIESQMLVIRSPLVLSEVVERLNLTENRAFMEDPQTPLSAFLENLVTGAMGVLGLDIVEEQRELAQVDLHETAVERLRRDLNVTRSGLTRVVTVSYTSASPELSATIANSVVQTFLAVRIENRVQSATRAAEWFDRRLAELNERALEAEQRLKDIGTNETLGGPGSENAQTRLSDLRLQLQNAMSERAEAQLSTKAYTMALLGGSGIAGLAEQYRTPEMQAFADALTALNSELVTLRESGGSDSRIDAIEREIERIEDILWGLIEDASREAEQRLQTAEVAEANAQETFLNAQSEDATRVSGTQQALIRQYENEAKVYRELQQSYFGSYVRTIQQQTFPSSGGTIIQTARAPEFPVGYGRKKVAVMAALVGVVLGIIIAVALENFERTVRSRQHLVQTTRRPLFGLLPPHFGKPSSAPLPVALSSPKKGKTNADGTMRPEIPATSKSFSSLIPEGMQIVREPMSVYSTSIKRARLELEKAMKADTRKVLIGRCITGFVSENKSAARSVASLNYAEMLALRGKRTLLIDLDWFDPKLTQGIAPDAKQGVVEISDNPSMLLEEPVLFLDQSTGLYFLGNRELSNRRVLSGVELDGSRTAAFLTMISAHFDEIVVDLPAMSASIDWLSISEICDGFVLVSDWGVTKRADLKDRMQNAGGVWPKVVGNLLAGVTEKEFSAYS